MSAQTTGLVGLRVTSDTIQQVATSNGKERIIGIRDLPKALEGGNGRRVKVRIGVSLELCIGDTGGAWASHQTTQGECESFEALYAMLSRMPDNYFVSLVQGPF